jgi:F420-dependent oxidoreductase-like protein
MFGSQLYNQQTSWAEITSVLDVMEAGRWTSVYTYDHFLPPWSFTAEVRDHDAIDTLEGWSLLAAMAAVTRRLKLGVLVSGNTYRNPALVAKMAATIDEISQGRVILGIGAGWNVREHEAYGWEYPSLGERSDRLEEACELIHKLLTSDGLVDFEGRYYRLKQAPFAPRGVNSKIPLMVGGTGEKRTLRTLALYGDQMNVIAGPDDVARLRGILESHCETVGRDPAEIINTVHVPMRIERDKKKAEHLRRGKDWQMIGSPQFVIDRCGAFIDAGVHEFCLQSIRQSPEVYQELDEEIFGAFV